MMIDKNRPAIFSLPESEAHVWDVSLLLPDEILESFAYILDESESAKAAGFKFEKHRRRYVAARGALRQILAGYLDCAPETPVFEANYYGKPFLKKNADKIEFNLAHSNDRALIAVVRDKRIGVDLEYRRSLIDTDGIAAQYFSDRENRAFEQLPENSRRAAFFDCWTRKEAFIKAIGKGLSQSLKSFDVSIDPAQPARLLSIDDSAAAGWQMFDLRISPDYSAAVIVEGAQIELKQLNWNSVRKLSYSRRE